jgi:hypothetical protein
MSMALCSSDSLAHGLALCLSDSLAHGLAHVAAVLHPCLSQVEGAPAAPRPSVAIVGA